MKSLCSRSSVLPLLHNTHRLTLHLLPHSKWTWGLSTTDVKGTCVEGCINTVLGKACIQTHTHTQTNTKWNWRRKKQIQKSKSTNRNSSSIGKYHVMSGNQVCCNPWHFHRDFNDNRGRRDVMKGNDTEANRRDEQRGGQEDGMNHHEWYLYSHALVWDEKRFICCGTGLLPGCAWI